MVNKPPKVPMSKMNIKRANLQVLPCAVNEIIHTKQCLGPSTHRIDVITHTKLAKASL